MKIRIFAFLFSSFAVLAQDKVIDPFAPASGTPKTQVPSGNIPAEDLRPRSERLKLLGEPALENLAEADRYPSVRLLWVRTFHAPISIRAYMTKEGPRLRVVRTSGKGGYDWGTLDFENDFPLKMEVWQQLLKHLEADGARQPFKNIKPEIKGLMGGLDGASWRLEVVDKAGYTVDEAWSPTSITDGTPEEKKVAEQHGIRLDNFVRLCKFLIRYAPIDPDSIY